MQRLRRVSCAILVTGVLALLVSLVSWRAFDGRAERNAPAAGASRPLTADTTLTLVAVQPRVTIDDYVSEEAFHALVDRLVARVKVEVPPAAREGPTLVAFPEDLATFLLCSTGGAIVRASPTVDGAIASLVRAHPLVVARTALQYGTGPLGALYLDRLPALFDVYRRVFSGVARALRATVVAGSMLAPDLDGPGPGARPLSRHVYNQSLAFDPDGREISRTRKVHVVPGFEDVLGVSGASPAWIQPFAVGPVRCATLICYDGFFPELGDLAASMGARILVQPSANPGRWDALIDDPRDGRILQRVQWFRDGLLARVDADRRFAAGLNPMLTGHILDLLFEGRSSIVVPRARTPDGSGILAIAPRPDAESIVWTRVRVEPDRAPLASVAALEHAPAAKPPL